MKLQSIPGYEGLYAAREDGASFVSNADRALNLDAY